MTFLQKRPVFAWREFGCRVFGWTWFLGFGCLKSGLKFGVGPALRPRLLEAFIEVSMVLVFFLA